MRARRLLVATGLTDHLPDVPGVAELWGCTVLHCPYCHGCEVKDSAIGVLGSGPQSVMQASLWRQWSEDVVLFPHTGPAPRSEGSERLDARGVRVVPGEVVGLDVADGAPGVWVAGNVGDISAQVMASAVQGLDAGAAINVDLLLEDIQHAVTAARASAPDRVLVAGG